MAHAINGPDDALAARDDEAMKDVVLDKSYSPADKSMNKEFVDHQRAQRPPQPNGAAPGDDRSEHGSGGAAEEPWPEPEDLGVELPTVPEFDLDLLPSRLRSWVEDVVDRMQVPLDFPAVVAIANLAGVCGRRAMIRPKQRDPWTVVPNLWGAIIAEPATMKSPTLREISAPAWAIEDEWQRQNKEAEASFTAEQQQFELDMRVWKELYIKSKTAKTLVAVPNKPKMESVEPARKRLLIVDATFESLHLAMANNPAGLFVVRDELSGWLAGLEKQGREGEREFYLQCWAGDSSFPMDRVSRGNIYVPNCCISLFGLIQPTRWRSYLTDVLRNGVNDDGLAQRFQLTVWPDMPPGWSYRDCFANSVAKNAAVAIYRDIASWNAQQPLILKFSSRAQLLFVDWITDLERNKLRSPDFSPVMIAHLGKYRSLMPSLALLGAIADGERAAVGNEHTQKAGDLCEYFESHARRMYAPQIGAERIAAIALGKRLQKGWKPKRDDDAPDDGTFTPRDIYRNEVAGISTAEETETVLKILENAKWVRKKEVRLPSGKASVVYIRNPKIVPLKRV